MVVALAAGCTQPAPAPTPTPTGNGVAALPPDQILATAKEALKATTFHLKGTPAPNVTADVHHKGEDAKGTFNIFGQSLEVTYVSNSLYLKASDDVWKQTIPADKQALILPLISSKWAKVNPANPAYANVVPSLDTLLKPTGTLTKGDATTVNATPAITLVDSDGGKVYVATQGAPVVLRIEYSTTVAIDFSEFGSAITVEAPAAGDVVDLTPYTS
jgi:hypothetical protein